MSESRDLVAAGRTDEGGGRPSGRDRPTDRPAVARQKDLRRREISNYNFRVGLPSLLGPREPHIYVAVCRAR